MNATAIEITPLRDFPRYRAAWDELQALQLRERELGEELTTLLAGPHTRRQANEKFEERERVRRRNAELRQELVVAEREHEAELRPALRRAYQEEIAADAAQLSRQLADWMERERAYREGLTEADLSVTAILGNPLVFVPGAGRHGSDVEHVIGYCELFAKQAEAWE
jgi:hypothetical protein